MSLIKEISSEINKVITELRKVLAAESLDILIAQSEIREVGGRKVVVKKFTSEIGLLKWLPPAIFLRASYPFAIAPRERFKRETKFMEFGEWSGFRVPRILSTDEVELVVVREYVEGEVVRCDRVADVRTLGKVLAEVHSRGFSLGDVKPTNFLISGSVPYVIDAEQSTRFREDMGSWDLVVVAFFISLASYMGTEKFRDLFGEFSESYLKSGGSRESYCGIISPKNAVMLTFMPLPNVLALSDVKKAYC
ncbi:MAG: hypothetical protein RMH84_00265 [Sulfolobales archaeon]|nr:hypothetical protein [Sulfolobales archaeon]MDW8010022.1 hypothetical protein [Sulfolobales archaeon]